MHAPHHCALDRGRGSCHLAHANQPPSPRGCPQITREVAIEEEELKKKLFTMNQLILALSQIRALPCRKAKFRIQEWVFGCFYIPFSKLSVSVSGNQPSVNQDHAHVLHLRCKQTSKSLKKLSKNISRNLWACHHNPQAPE